MNKMEQYEKRILDLNNEILTKIKENDKKFENQRLIKLAKEQHAQKLNTLLNSINPKITSGAIILNKLRNPNIRNLKLKYITYKYDPEAYSEGRWDLRLSFMHNFDETSDLTKILDYFEFEEIADAICDALDEIKNRL